jgi:hypothetical protein
MATITVAIRFINYLISKTNSRKIRDPYISDGYIEANGRLQFASRYRFSPEATMAAAVTQPHEPSFINVIFRKTSNRGLNIPAQPIPRLATAIDRINLASDALQFSTTPDGNRAVPFFVSGMYHVNQQEAGLADHNFGDLSWCKTLQGAPHYSREICDLWGFHIYLLPYREWFATTSTRAHPDSNLNDNV